MLSIKNNSSNCRIILVICLIDYDNMGGGVILKKNMTKIHKIDAQ